MIRSVAPRPARQEPGRPAATAGAVAAKPVAAKASRAVGDYKEPADPRILLLLYGSVINCSVRVGLGIRSIRHPVLH